VFLGVDLDTPGYNRATLTRGVRQVKQLMTWFQLTAGGADTPHTDELRTFPSTGAATGRLRLVRTGSVLAHSAAEGTANEFLFLRQHPFGADDVKAVRVGGYTGGPNAALEVRVTDLRVRADSMPGMPEVPGVPEPPGVPGAQPPTPKPGGKGWLGAALVLGLVLALGALGLWLLARRGRPGQMPAPAPVADSPADPEKAAPGISFGCSGCGKRLKARAEMAGKKVKCPQCGQAVLVAAATP
jgi:DNA-directed RNA polymerase subunit RPC12/RpoP